MIIRITGARVRTESPYYSGKGIIFGGSKLTNFIGDNGWIMMLAKPIGKRPILLFLALTLVHFSVLAQNADELYRMKTIVIDAGHGGKDPGNLGTGRYKTKEKDIALDVALRVGSYINKQFPEINVVYTRSTDVFIGLNERADIANKAKADLFLSIHCNAASNTAAYGVETYALGLHKNKENLEVAMKENSAIFLEDDYKTKYEGFDPNSAESIIALTIMQSAFLQQSLSISFYIQQQFKERVGRRDRGVKQAGFLVLRKTTMPSILIELGFLTNKGEEDFLNSEDGKAYMASAIFRGFKEYKNIVEDPLPEGYEAPEVDATSQAEKQRELDDRMNSAAQAKLDSIQDAEAKERLKRVADSLEQAKQKLLEEKKQREKELKEKAEEAKKAQLKATADSLEAVKQQKLEAMKKRQDEIAAQAAKEEAERKQREAEEARKAEEAKRNATEWLEEIKAEKERELAEAKAKAALDSEKSKLETEKERKMKELEEARKQMLRDSSHRMVQERIMVAKEKEAKDSLYDSKTNEAVSLVNIKQRQQEETEAKYALEKKQQAKQDSILRERTLALKKAKEDSLERVLKEERLEAERSKRRQDSIAAARKAEAERIEAQIGNEKATSPEEAELLFLQLRKKQLEERIAKLKSQNVTAPTKDEIEKRAASKPIPENAVNSNADRGVVFKVQVVTSSEPLSATDPRLKGQDVWQYQQDGLYKFTVGNTVDFEEITKLQAELRNLGFTGAFVVAFKNGERIKVSEAREILNGSE